MRQEVNTGVWKEAKLDDRIGTTNIAKAAQGDGIRLAKAAGASTWTLRSLIPRASP